MGAATAPPCSPGQICSEQFGTKVDGTNLYFSTATTISPDNKGTTTLNYWNGSEWKASATSENGKPFTPTADSPLSDSAKLSLKSGDLGKNASAATSQSLDKAGVPKTTKDNIAPGSKNQAQNTEGGDGTGGNTKPTAADQESFGKENESFKEGTRLEYGDAKYPLDLSSENQDCIKFSILEYRPSLAQSQGGTATNSFAGAPRGVTIDKNRNPTVGSKILGTITLPVPAGINDNNQVSWQEGELNVLQTKFGSIANSYISQGTEGGGAALNNAAGSFSEAVKSGEAQQGIAGLIAGLAVNADKFQQRAYGSIFNNNLELLFTSPSLRSFSFTFKLSPRNAKEAKEIMKIIRFFKQAMSVKRSKASLLLKSPHTFAISYLTSNKQHPYLNKFKECALTNFGVDYTPEGQYMTYMSSNIDERSMISYNITLQFQELEPVFDDEYGNETTITNIGY
jgi:hypothetical protein